MTLVVPSTSVFASSPISVTEKSVAEKFAILYNEANKNDANKNDANRNLSVWRSSESLSQEDKQLDSDYKLLKVICDEIESFHDRLGFLTDEMNQSDIFPPNLEFELISEWAAYLRRRKVLLTIADRYKEKTEVKRSLTFGPTIKQKKVILGYCASLFLFSSAVRLVNLFDKPSNKFWTRLDEGDTTLDIREKTLSSLWRTVTSISAIRIMAEAKKDYFKSYPEAQELAEAGVLSSHWLHSKILTDIAFLDKEGPNIWTEKFKQLWQVISSGFHKPYYNIFSAIAIWVGDTKYLRIEPALRIEQAIAMTEKLIPGDILLEREDWYLSNAFLPGFWPHGIVYVGTADDLRELGLHKDPRVAPHMAAFEMPDHHGYKFRVIESISEGVLMNTMEHATEADYVCAFRPQVSLEVKKEAIARAFGYIGRPYDFSFNFNSADKLVCTEVLWRTYGDTIRFDEETAAGKPVIQGTGIINKFARERNSESKQLQFLFFMDSNRKTGESWFATADDLILSNSRKGLAFLNEQD